MTDPDDSTCAEASERMRAFEREVRAADPAIRYVTARLVGGDVDDVLQTAYLKAFRLWDTFRGESSRRTWLHRIAHTTAIDHLRGLRRRQALVSSLAADGTTADIAHRAVAHLDVGAALDQLSVELRGVLLLVDGLGYGHADAATVLDIPAGTVASRLHRARRAMRELLDDRSEHQ